MNKKYLIGFELQVRATNDHDKKAKISFEFIQDLRRFLMNNIKISLTKFEEREEVHMYATINPKEVPLISTGEDKITSEMIDDFEYIYSEFSKEFYQTYENGGSGYVSYSINPMYFIVKHGDVVIYRNYNLEVYKGLNGTIIWKDFNEVFKQQVPMVDRYRKRDIMIEKKKYCYYGI
ncbi:hypothetical protein [Clostridium estertheticum]|uniref:Uncharacterized protein n=1 Tax=Clostridium estertheticum subsp. estertheticum TaxID=1552 RepID=A0A1J0GC20_9CLOT|nr:hypothetical protein [Clostridium estertheticum]APC38889.1 hypothetical protein A7L45_01805 [Clostridium estertheticum subsp. estertheticum]MBZ9615165.1 hypothetical protein [Clostridium estertheticum subsp. laramiense]WAG75059.1 hypothetical protein LL032_06300 [Clostridium estertheticum]